MHLHSETVDELEHEFFVLFCCLKRVQQGLIDIVGLLEVSLILLDHEEANVEELGRLTDNFLTNLKLHALLKRHFQALIKLRELTLQQFHLERLQEK